MDLGGFGPQPDVVAVERDVQDAHGDLHAFDALDLAGQAAGQVVAAVGDADQHDALDAAIAFDDLVGDAGEGAADVVRLHDSPAHTPTPPRAGEEACMNRIGRLPSRPHGTGFKGEERSHRAYRGAAPSRNDPAGAVRNAQRGLS